MANSAGQRGNPRQTGLFFTELAEDEYRLLLRRYLSSIGNVGGQNSTAGFDEDDRDSAIDQIPRSAECYPASVMEAKGLTPILNVSDIASTVAWFEKWGWKKLWDWGTPPTFGAVGSGKETCIFLCQGAQGGRGRGPNTTTFQQDGDEAADKGLDVGLGGRRGRDAQAMRGRRAGGHIPAHRYAVERPRDAPSPSGWPRVPRRPRIRGQEVEN